MNTGLRALAIEIMDYADEQGFSDFSAFTQHCHDEKSDWYWQMQAHLDLQIAILTYINHKT